MTSRTKYKLVITGFSIMFVVGLLINTALMTIGLIGAFFVWWKYSAKFLTPTRKADQSPDEVAPKDH